jgi:hypothetical protein
MERSQCHTFCVPKEMTGHVSSAGFQLVYILDVPVSNPGQETVHVDAVFMVLPCSPRQVL